MNTNEIRISIVLWEWSLGITWSGLDWTGLTLLGLAWLGSARLGSAWPNRKFHDVRWERYFKRIHLWLSFSVQIKWKCMGMVKFMAFNDGYTRTDSEYKPEGMNWIKIDEKAIVKYTCVHVYLHVTCNKINSPSKTIASDSPFPLSLSLSLALSFPLLHTHFHDLESFMYANALLIKTKEQQ